MALLASLWAAAASAYPVQVLGWSKDSEGFVYFTDGKVIVLRSRVREELRFPVKGLKADGTVEDAPEALEQWLAQHPLARSLPSRRSPDGRSQAEVGFPDYRALGLPMERGWGFDSWTPGGSLTFSVTREGKTTELAWGDWGESVEVYWSPDSRRTAWVVRNPETRLMRALDKVQLETDGSCQALLFGPFEHIAQIEALGCLVVDSRLELTDPELKLPCGTVTYSDSRHELAAKRVADALKLPITLVSRVPHAAVSVCIAKPAKK